MNCTSSTSRPILTLGDYSLYRGVVNSVKSCDPSVIREAAGMITSSLSLPHDGVLIPVPSHLGHATDMLLLSREISLMTGLPVLDILRGSERMSIHLLKKSGMSLPEPDALGLYLCGEMPVGMTTLLVDNVIGTGVTMKAALALLPSGVPCTLAVDTMRMSL